MRISIQMSEDDTDVDVSIDVPLPPLETTGVTTLDGKVANTFDNTETRLGIARAMAENASEAALIASFGPVARKGENR